MPLMSQDGKTLFAGNYTDVWSVNCRLSEFSPIYTHLGGSAADRIDLAGQRSLGDDDDCGR